MYKTCNVIAIDLAIALDKLELLERYAKAQNQETIAEEVHKIAEFLNDANK